MRRIDPTTLELGRPLQANLYDVNGDLLWAQGYTPDALDLSMVSDRLQNGLFADGPLEANPVEDIVRRTADFKDRRVVSVRMLETGTTLPRDILDDRGVLLLSAGQVITKGFIGKLCARGLTTIRVGDLPPDPAPGDRDENADGAVQDHPQRPSCTEPLSVSRDSAKRIEQALDDMAAKSWDQSLPATPPNRGRQKLDLKQISQLVDAGRESLARSTATVDTLVYHASRGNPPDTEEARGVVNRFQGLVSHNATAALQLLSQADADQDADYLVQHALRVSLLAMAMADQLGYGPQDVEAVGMGALIQDLGMLHVPDAIRYAERPLSKEEWEQVRLHPLKSIEIAEQMKNLDDTARIIVYQSHERCDGSGYPTGKTGDQIHPLARIVAVADSYVALTNPRPHRKSRSPYDASVILLTEARKKRLDADAVRTFMHTVSLFPVGSVVRLSDNTVARVFAANGQNMTQPVVTRLSDPDQLIDLAQHPGLTVTGALPDQEAKAA